MSVRKHSQTRQLINGCIGKHAYNSEAEAHQKGQATYYCIYCNNWHRTSIKLTGVRKNGIPNLSGVSRKKVAPCPHCAQKDAALLALQQKLTARGQQIADMAARHAAYKRENHRLRERYDRTVNGRIERFISRTAHHLKKRFGK